MIHDSMENYMMQNFYLMIDYHQDMNYWDNMLPFEREIYLTLLTNKIEKENEQRRQQQQ
jgi:hypothetical protein